MPRLHMRLRTLPDALVGTCLWTVYAAIVFAIYPDGINPGPIVEFAGAVLLGLIVALRVNRAYDRWSEGRANWARLLGASRNLAVKVKVYGSPNEEECAQVRDAIVGVATELRDELRDEAGARHDPDRWITELQETFLRWLREDRYTPSEVRMLDTEARVLLDVCSACESIRTTAVPPALTSIARGSVIVALLAAPWILESDLGWVAVPVAGGAAFLVLAVEMIVGALEQPFGDGPNCLDLDEFCAEIEHVTTSILRP